MHKCLKDLSVYHFATHELSLNQSTLDLLKSDQRVVIFGHIGSIPAPKTDEEVLIKKRYRKMPIFSLRSNRTNTKPIELIAVLDALCSPKIK